MQQFAKSGVKASNKPMLYLNTIRTKKNWTVELRSHKRGYVLHLSVIPKLALLRHYGRKLRHTSRCTSDDEVVVVLESPGGSVPEWSSCGAADTYQTSKTQIDKLTK